MMCIGIWLVGLVINFIQQQPPFFYPSVIGGFVWTTGGCVTPTLVGGVIHVSAIVSTRSLIVLTASTCGRIPYMQGTSSVFPSSK